MPAKPTCANCRKPIVGFAHLRGGEPERFCGTGCMDRFAKKKEATRATMRVAAAYVFDRAHQYVQSSGTHHALCEVAAALWEGEAEAAHAHGELDDVIKYKTARRARKEG